jgi:hypothetical protein
VVTVFSARLADQAGRTRSGVSLTVRQILPGVLRGPRVRSDEVVEISNLNGAGLLAVLCD